MVEAIGAAIITAAASTAGYSGAVIAGYAIAGVSLSTIVGTTALVGGSLLVQTLTTPDSKQKVASRQFATRQALPPRRRAYGRVKLSGPFVAYDAYNGGFYIAVYLVEGPIDAIEEYWLDDKQAAWPAGSLGGPAGVAPWLAAVTLEAHLGTPDQAASPLLMQLPYWTADYRLRGCAYLAQRAAPVAEKFFQKVYESGSWPQPRAVLRASKVRNVNDPAQTSDPATWAWSDNAALCIRDFLTHPTWGMQVPEALIDDDSFRAMADLCATPIVNRYGNTYPRYFLAGTYDLTDEPADVLQGMLDACDGRLFLTPDGKIGITGGRYVPPEVTIGQDAVISIGSLEVGSGKRATFNRLKTSFVSWAHDYQQIEGEPWDDIDGQAEAGEILEQDFSRPWVSLHNQLRRLAKIHTAKQNPRFRITGLTTGRAGLPALYEDVIRLNLPRYGIDAVFRVERAVAAGDGSTCTFDLASIDPTAWDFDAATEEGETPPLPNAEAAPEEIPAPTNLTVLVERRAVSGGVSAVFARLVAAEPERADLSLIGRYRRVGDSAWLDTAAEGDNRASLISSVLADGEVYELQGALTTYGRARQSAWSVASGSPVTATADPVAPGAPTGLTVNVSAGIVTLNWLNANSANVAAARLYRGAAGSSFAQATLIRTIASGPSQAVSANDSRPAGTWLYWVVNANGSGVPSAPAGPATATVT